MISTRPDNYSLSRGRKPSPLAIMDSGNCYEPKYSHKKFRRIYRFGDDGNLYSLRYGIVRLDGSSCWECLDCRQVQPRNQHL